VKILVTSYHYDPSVGGIETVSKLMVAAFREAGHEVVVVTSTPDPGDECSSPAKVVRRPSLGELWKLAGWADVVWQNNIALTYLWVFKLRRVPVAVTLACAVFPDLPRKNFRQRLKYICLKSCRVFSISDYVVEGTTLRHEKIGNPFDESIPSVTKGVPKEKDIVFIGRLVSDKGVDVLLDALARLQKRALSPTCTIIGDGPEKEALEKQMEAAGLEQQVTFAGSLKGADLYREMARHRIMAVPSRWKEPFGVVALEGIAAGCAVVGSEAGGLPEAIGPCGLTFPNGDTEALAEVLAHTLSGRDDLSAFTKQADAHLDQFRVATQSERYLKTFKEISQKQSCATNR
jgi:glycosyltransferase involved in cell wall biosynthesis